MVDKFNLSVIQAITKRSFDFILAFIGLLAASWLIALSYIVATIDTRSNGFFLQKRVGKNGCIFTVIKIKTMRPGSKLITTVTQSGDSRITPLGRFFRRNKIDELPQLWNVLKGDMSFVGPRPDVPGFADQLQGDARNLLGVRPGITGPATLKYRDEEKILSLQTDPETFNLEVIYPDKVRINLDYIRHWSLASDLKYIWQTVIG